jgi:hypothetical protein
MKAQYLNLMKEPAELKEIHASVSLKPFVSFLKDRIGRVGDVRAPFFKYVLGQIQSVEGWADPIGEEDIPRFGDIFELVYFTLTPPITREEDFMWAIGEPLTPHILFGTEGFFRLLTRGDGKINRELFDNNARHNKTFDRLKIVYGLVLTKLYGYSFPIGSEMRVSVSDEDTGLTRYFRIEFDTRFIDIHVGGGLPEIDLSYFDVLHNEKESIAYLQQVLPLSELRFEGFSVVHIVDVTGESAVEHIKDLIVNLVPGEPVFRKVIDSLRTLLGSQDTYLNLFPALKVNGKLVMESLAEMDSSFKKLCVRKRFTQDAYLATIEKFLENPKLTFVSDISQARDSEIDKPVREVLVEMGITALAVVPISFQKKPVGVMQIFARRQESLSANMLARLNPVIPLLEQLFQAHILDFNNRIDQVIKRQFTALHPAVLWRFNQAAWNYIRDTQSGKEVSVESVRFPDVYPLYGAVDIRDSTKERNDALRKDMSIQLSLLDRLLQSVKKVQSFGLVEEIADKTHGWREQIGEYIMPEDEFRLYRFLENEAAPLLKILAEREDVFKKLARGYFKAIAPDGEAYVNRRRLENTLQLINRIISGELDKMNAGIQQIYPCYFERFRTDGIEYDIYVGQSITPGVPFHSFYLKNVRLAQLSSMVEIARQSQAVLPQLSKKLLTTQLIYVNTNTIDISFRNDERRFDVEGGYNVRYEMIKKRIDKVCVLHTTERLTQPGKIALVYFQRRDVEEYLTHIQYLQKKGLLLDDLEYLDLEPLQGVDGLRALRVGIRM